jgi:hypothetical protein
LKKAGGHILAVYGVIAVTGALVAGELPARAKRRAGAAEAGRREIERFETS